LTREGFVVMRVEKSGMGDSQGVPCQLQDFENELAGYRAALAKLRTYSFVDASRIYILGHSMGGLQAPILASEAKVRGIVVMTTAGHKWLEYEEENAKRQMALEGVASDELLTRVALRRECLSRLLIRRETPEAIVKDRADCEGSVQSPAHYTYMQQLAALDPVALWKKVSAPVLIIHGASDFVTSEEEHRIIERAVNSKHKRHATLLIEPRMDHFMREVASPAESMRAMKADGGETLPLRTKVQDDIVEWLKKH
jgi:pimeloyl-ACP methyl ester carboxylesterase